MPLLLRAFFIGFAVYALAGCRPLDRIDLMLEPDVVRPAKSVVIFLVDGMDLTRMQELAAAGVLPNIQESFLAGGVRVRNAVSSLPSVTYPNCTSVITGVFPGHHGIMGNFWFDRRTLRTHFYMTYETYRTVNDHFTSPTLYQLLDDHFTLNLQNHTRRGVSETIDNRLMFGLSWLLHEFDYADRHVGLRFKEVAETANKVKRWPSVTMTYYPGVDEIAHRYGSNSAEYKCALANIDSVVGLVTDAVRRAGLADSTYYVLLSDHGHVPIPAEKRVDVCQWLAQHRHMRVRSEPLTQDQYIQRLDVLREYDAVGGLDADRVIRFHLRGSRGWAHPIEAAEIEEWIRAEPMLTCLPAVLFVLHKMDADRVRFYSRNGIAHVERRRDVTGVKYRLVNDKNDPLGYGGMADWHISREWLATTADGAFPDFVPQVVEMFDSPHTGDVVLFAAEDWSFSTTQFGGHGSCLPRDMHIPLFFAGPDLPKGAEIGPGRLVDVMPTIIGLLDETKKLEGVTLDGINLADQLRNAHAEPQSSQR